MTSERDRWIAIYIAALSAVLALGILAGDDVSKERITKTTEAANVWAWWQAKRTRVDQLTLTVEELEMRLVTGALTDPRRRAIAARIADYRREISKLESEPETGEGLKELFQRGKALEAERDLADALDPVFDRAQALLQIAVVLASVAIAAGGVTAIALSAGCAVVGAVLMAQAYAIARPEVFGVVTASIGSWAGL